MNIAPARPRCRDIATGNDVGVVVRAFYRAVIADPLLGPVFERYGVDWPSHIPKLERYWQHVLLAGPGNSANTIAAHAPVQRAAPFDDRHIDRWLDLWSVTIDDLYVGPVAEHAKTRARQVGRALRTVVGRQRANPSKETMMKGTDTLAMLVAQDASRAVTLDRLGLDYCCGGDTTFNEACARAGLDPDTVATQLDATPATDHDHDCGDMTPNELITHLLDTHHTYLHHELPEIHELADKVLAAHGARHPELNQVRALVGLLADDLEPHMIKEERILFPAIMRLTVGEAEFPFGTIRNPIRMMNLEHDDAGALLAQLRAVSNDYRPPDDACASYQALNERLARLEHDTHLHIFEENHLLFPQATTLEDASTR